MSKTMPLAAAGEIIGALLSNDVGGDAAALKANGKNYISENYGVDIGSVDLRIVENSTTTQHLSLPYYSALDTTGVSSVSDTSAADVAGGAEIGFSVVAGVIAVAAIGAASGTAIAASLDALPHQQENNGK